MKNESRHISKEDFQRYLTNQMSSTERNKFERVLQQNPFEYEAMEGLSSQDSVVIADDLNILQAKIQNKKKKNNLFLRIAAVALILITSGILFYTINNNEALKQVVENRVPKEAIPKAEEKAIDLSDKEKQPEEVNKNIFKEEKRTSLKKFTETSKTEKIEEKKVAETPAIPQSITEDQVEIIEKIEEKNNLKTPTLQQNDKTLNIEPKAFNVQESRSKMTMDLLSLDSEKEKTPQEFKPISGLASRATLTSDEDTNQFFNVHGKVLSKEDNEPIPGVNVVAKGTALGTITDLEGKFTLDLPDDMVNTFVASYIGMENNEFKNTPDSENVIIMKESEMGLDEVVVVGSGSQKRGNLLGSTSASERSSQATPIGGFKGYYKYLKEESKFSDLSAEQKNVVRVKLLIDKNGSITKITPLNNPDSILLKRTKQIILDGPDWTPEIRNGKVVDSETIIRLRFKIK